ncbi:chloride channel protein [Roseibium sp.]|uniref:chloride channel protein n=1 Tax=Roseibium sp. TaxID=1936156 RepID=UPI003A981F1C
MPDYKSSFGSRVARFCAPLRIGWATMRSTIRVNLKSYLEHGFPQVWLISPLIGVLVGIAAILFREGIGLIQLLWLGTRSEHVVTAAAGVSPWVILLAPAVGGLLVGLLLKYLQPMQRTYSVADVIEARAKAGDGLPFWSGLSSALITMISLGSGGSAGREGPMVHLGATLGALFTNFTSLPASSRRLLLACGVASAVSGSFNAPIAGLLFAHEVILGHYALSAIAPVAIASAMGAILSRLWFGDVAAFVIPAHQVTSYWEFPAFALLGLTCAAVAILFQCSLIGTDWLARHVPLPTWLRPAIGGLMVGAIALFFPEIIGVGYETTDAALRNQLSLQLMLVLLAVKTAATAITLASRFGGGIFSPALYLGAMAGGAFGLIAAAAFPELASSEGLYSILGMGGVAAAVLGAPISTTVIVFELTGGYALSLALLLTVSFAVGLTHALLGKSYFHWQLEIRGLSLAAGSHLYLRDQVKVRDFMDPLPEGQENASFDPAKDGLYLQEGDTLTKALRSFDESGEASLPVVHAKDPTRVVGHARHVRSLRFFNRALIDESTEAHY